MEGNKLSISEKDFSTQVEYLLDLFDWRWCHFRPARTEDGWTTALSGFMGFPDYIAVKESLRKQRLLFFELKSEKGKLTKNQNDWLEALKKSGYCEVYLFRPSNAERLAEILR